MKRLCNVFLIGILTAAISFSLFGCGGSKPVAEQPTNNPAPVTTPSEPDDDDTPTVPDAGTVAVNPNDPYGGIIIRFEELGESQSINSVNLPMVAIVDSEILVGYVKQCAAYWERDSNTNVDRVVITPDDEVRYSFVGVEYFENCGLVLEFVPKNEVGFEFYGNDGGRVNGRESWKVLLWSQSLGRAITPDEIYQGDTQIGEDRLEELWPESYAWLKEPGWNR